MYVSRVGHVATCVLLAFSGGCNRKHGDGYKMEQVAASGARACAAMKDGSVRCWGRDHGKTPIVVPSLTDVVSVCVGDGFACGRRGDGRVSCTAADLGVDAIHGATAIACGDDEMCALCETKLLCVSRRKPLHEVPGASGAVAVAKGGGTTCVVLGDGTAKCWGRGKHGQLGNGHFEDRDEPELVAALDVRSVAVGKEHACAVLRNETLVCFGANDDGQLGDGSTTASAVPHPASGVTIASEVSCGAHHTCARMGDSTIRCWGKNDVHQAGISDAPQVLVSTLVPGLYESESVTAGDDFTCVRMKDGWLRCFGVNDWGQLGDGTTEIKNVPTPIRY